MPGSTLPPHRPLTQAAWPRSRKFSLVLKEIVDGESVLDSRSLPGSSIDPATRTPSPSGLSPEREVLSLIAEGCSKRYRTSPDQLKRLPRAYPDVRSVGGTYVDWGQDVWG
jgi:hypothetical protein